MMPYYPPPQQQRTPYSQPMYPTPTIYNRAPPPNYSQSPIFQVRDENTQHNPSALLKTLQKNPDMDVNVKRIYYPKQEQSVYPDNVPPIQPVVPGTQPMPCDCHTCNPRRYCSCIECQQHQNYERDGTLIHPPVHQGHQPKPSTIVESAPPIIPLRKTYDTPLQARPMAVEYKQPIYYEEPVKTDVKKSIVNYKPKPKSPPKDDDDNYSHIDPYKNRKPSYIGDDYFKIQDKEPQRQYNNSTTPPQKKKFEYNTSSKPNYNDQFNSNSPVDKYELNVGQSDWGENPNHYQKTNRAPLKNAPSSPYPNPNRNLSRERDFDRNRPRERESPVRSDSNGRWYQHDYQNQKSHNSPFNKHAKNDYNNHRRNNNYDDPDRWSIRTDEDDSKLLRDLMKSAE